jgi:hypothetical protein
MVGEADIWTQLAALLLELLRTAALAALVIVGAYVLLRAASVAYFRTKLEHFRSVMKELRGEHHGEE